VLLTEKDNKNQNIKEFKFKKKALLKKSHFLSPKLNIKFFLHQINFIIKHNFI
jgi:hypothetical protein